MMNFHLYCLVLDGAIPSRVFYIEDGKYECRKPIAAPHSTYIGDDGPTILVKQSNAYLKSDIICQNQVNCVRSQFKMATIVRKKKKHMAP